MRRAWRAALAVAVTTFVLQSNPREVSAQATAKARPRAAKSAPSSAAEAEKRTEAGLKAARENPLQLYHFLLAMPKGADLHNHLSGAVYAESWIRAAAEDGLCVDVAKLSFVKVARDAGCGTGNEPALQALEEQPLYDALIDAFSMRGFVASPGVTGHDHFFEAFGRFGGTDKRHLGEWVDEVATRAAAQNEQYLELMHTPPFEHAAQIAREIGWQSDMAHLRQELLERGLRDEIDAARKQLDEAETVRRRREGCGQATAAAACKVDVRFLYQVLRGFPKEQVFAQTLLGFETATADPRFVGINYVMPEDGYTSMADYALHMKIVGFLHGLYPKVHISLHAGEIAPGLVPWEGLCCHIRLAVEDGHAERIGHGTDVMYEEKPHELLREMAAKHVMVEINLTSNEMILGVSGKEHPLGMYRQFTVPVALSTDDEGVERINLTHEYVKAVETYNLSYADLKQMARTGIEHSFLPGASLWAAPDQFDPSKPAAACAKDTPGADMPSAGCGAFLKASEKARQQWELERRLRVFEASN
jgi:adenosine deaminase